MSRETSPGSVNAEDEVAALIETLRQTGERLEELTGGEVDSVADPEGRTFLLRGVHQQLRDAEAAEQAAILNALPTHIALLDGHGQILSVNEAWRQFARANKLLSPESAKGDNYLDVCDRAQGPNSSEAREAATGLRAVLSGTTKSYSLEYPCHSPTEQRWFLMTITPLADDRLNGAVVMHLNITERKRIEASLRDSEQRFAGAFEYAPNGVALVSPDGRWLKVNRALCDLLGYSAIELLNHTFQDITYPEDLGPDLENVRRLLAGEIHTYEMEKRYIHARGHLVTAMLNVSLVRDDKDKPRYFISQIQDITQRKQTEIRINYLSRVYAMLSNINALMVRAHSRDELYREMCRIAVEDGGFRMSLIGIVDRNTQKIVPVASGGKDDELLTAIKDRLSSTEGAATTMVAMAIREKKNVVSNDSLKDPRVVFSPQYAASGIRSMAIFPLMVADEAVGVLALYASEVEFFHKEEVNLLTGLANDIAFALTSIGNEEKISRLSRIQAVMSGINAVIVRVRDVQGLFDDACRVAVEQGNFGTAWIGLLDAATQKSVQVAWAGRNLHPPGVQIQIDAVTGRGVASRAIREKRLVVDNDIASSSSAGGARRPMALAAGFRSMVALPFIVGGAVVGHLSLYTKEPNFFNDDELKLLSDMAGNIAFALEHIDRQQKLEKVSQIVESSRDAIASSATDGTILTWNAGAEKMFGYTSEEVVGQKVGLLVPDELRQDTQLRRQRYLSSGNFDAYESERLTKDQRRVSVSVNYSVIKDRTNKIIGVATIYRDITERKQAETALLQLNEALEDKVEARTVDLRRARQDAEQANQAKSSFLAAMSHEIRTPMNGVIGMIDVLQQSSLKGDQMEMVDLIRESAFSLLGIINDILDFSKIEAGKLELEREVIEVADVVEGVCGLLNGMADKKDVALIVYIDPAIPAQVLGDALRLRQVLVNFVNNAIKFSSGQSRAGRVSVRALLIEKNAEQVTVEFRVADNGVGMDGETQARLFTAFTQADVSTTRRFGGTGLGLAIASNLVQLMGGEITVQSAPDQGATFRVRLPFVSTPAGTIVIEATSDVAGLCCVVVGAAGLADDLADYLKHAHADVERAPDLASARAQGADRGGLSVWVVDAVDEPQSLERIRAAAHAKASQDVRFVVVLIERGKRRRPRAMAPDMITVDGNALNRRTFLRAVAAAAGRASLEMGPEKRAFVKPALIAPSREDALRQGRLILIAEDNETNQKVIVRQLALLGYAADIAADGREALEYWHSGDYAMLLTDLHMPKMDGYELTQAIRAEEKAGKRIPIVALTANALKGEAEHCRAVGMDDYQSKPSPLVELRAVVEKWLPVALPGTNVLALPVPSKSAASQVTAIMPAASVAPVDVKVLKALVGDDADLIREFLQDFRSSAARITLELRAACATGQTKLAADGAHKLKSSARAVGAFDLGDLCAAIEEVGRTGNGYALNALLPLLEAEMAVVDGYLDIYANTPIEAV